MEKSTSGFSKFLGYFITLLIGLLIGYFVCKKTGSATTAPMAGDTTKVALTNTDTISHHISDSLAHVLIAQFQSENSKADNPLKNNKGDLLNGFFIDRQPLDHILKDKTISGISVYLAKDSTAHVTRKPDRMYTLVYIGGRYNKAYKIGGSLPKIINMAAVSDTDTFDYVKPCPDACGDFLSLTKKAPLKK